MLTEVFDLESHLFYAQKGRNNKTVKAEVTLSNFIRFSQEKTLRFGFFFWHANCNEPSIFIFFPSIPGALAHPAMRENHCCVLQPKIYFYIPNVKRSTYVWGYTKDIITSTLTNTQQLMIFTRTVENLRLRYRRPYSDRRDLKISWFRMTQNCLFSGTSILPPEGYVSFWGC